MNIRLGNHLPHLVQHRGPHLLESLRATLVAEDLRCIQVDRTLAMAQIASDTVL